MNQPSSRFEDTDSALIQSIPFSNLPVNAMSPGHSGMEMKALQKAVADRCLAFLLEPDWAGVLAGAARRASDRDMAWNNGDGLRDERCVACRACADRRTAARRKIRRCGTVYWRRSGGCGPDPIAVVNQHGA